MKIVKVKTEMTPIRLLCRHCGRMIDSNSMYADLDGEPFKAYYCEDWMEDYLAKVKPHPAVRFQPINASSGYIPSIPGRALFVWDGQPKRKPKAGEYFMSGAIAEAYQAMHDLNSEYFIVVPLPYTLDK